MMSKFFCLALLINLHFRVYGSESDPFLDQKDYLKAASTPLNPLSKWIEGDAQKLQSSYKSRHGGCLDTFTGEFEEEDSILKKHEAWGQS